MQVFFYFCGHGATIGQDTVMVGDDGRDTVSFYSLFHTEVACTGAITVAVLNCCRSTTPSEFEKADHVGGPPSKMVLFPLTTPDFVDAMVLKKMPESVLVCFLRLCVRNSS